MMKVLKILKGIGVFIGGFLVFVFVLDILFPAETEINRYNLEGYDYGYEYNEYEEHALSWSSYDELEIPIFNSLVEYKEWFGDLGVELRVRMLDADGNINKFSFNHSASDGIVYIPHLTRFILVDEQGNPNPDEHFHISIKYQSEYWNNA